MFTSFSSLLNVCYPNSVGAFHPFDTYVTLPRSPETWVVEPLLPAGGKLNIYSPPKVGKSWAALQLAIDVAAKKDKWLGFPLHMHGNTLYLQLDTPRGLWVDEYLLRLKAADYATGSGEYRVHFSDREEIPSYPFDIRYKPHGDWLRSSVDRINPVLVVVDTWREAFRGNENDTDTSQDVLSSLVAATYPAALVIISHASKPTHTSDGEVKKSVVNGLRGSSYLSGAVDGIIEVGKTGFSYISRRIEESKMKMERHPSGLWVLPQIP